MLLVASVLFGSGLFLFAFTLPELYTTDDRGRAVRYGRFVGGILLILVGLVLLPSVAAPGMY